MNFNNFHNSKVTEYGNKNFPVHKQSKSIDLPIINNNQYQRKMSGNSLSENSMVFKIDPNKKIIMEDLSNILNKFDKNIDRKVKNAKSEKKIINPEVENLQFYEKFYKKFKVSEIQ